MFSAKENRNSQMFFGLEQNRHIQGLLKLALMQNSHAEFKGGWHVWVLFYFSMLKISIMVIVNC